MSQAEFTDHLRASYQTVPQVIESFEWLETYFIRNEDLRGVFATAYLHITKSINEALNSGHFEDRSWTQSYLTRFANLYREALLNFELETDGFVAKAWRISFDLADKKEGLILQHLLLGINAHINHDLAIALHQVKIDPNRHQKYSDHTRVNAILEESTNELKRKVADKYAPILNSIDRALGSLDDDVTSFSIPKAREHAWSFAIAFTAAQSKDEQNILLKSLDEQAAVLANLIMASPTRDTRFTGVLGALKWIDRKIKQIINFFRF